MVDGAGEAGKLSPRALANLRKDLVSGLVKTRKFAVLDREFGAQIRDEKNPSDADRSEAGRTDKLGQEATADYVVSGAVKRFDDGRSQQTMRLSGRTITQYNYDLAVSIQVIDVVSRRVLFSDTFGENAAGTVQAGSPNFDQWIDGAVTAVAAKACIAVLELIYPLKVASITDNGDVILNEGSGRVSENDQFEIFAVGRPLKDPDTGVEIGREETLQATVRIYRVLPKLSYAKIETGTGAQIAAGAICRKSKIRIQNKNPGENPETSRPKKVKVDGDL